MCACVAFQAKESRDNGCGFSLRLVAPAMVGYGQQHKTVAMDDLDKMLAQTVSTVMGAVPVAQTP